MNYRRIAKRRWPKAAWISGDGPHACIAYCPRAITVTLWDSAERAERAKRVIDNTGCGGLCCDDHAVEDLSAAARPERAAP